MKDESEDALLVEQQHSRYSTIPLLPSTTTQPDNDSVSYTTTSLPIFNIVAILSTAFSYGCILTTLFIITLPIECERINIEHPDIPKSVALGVFVAIAGATQLVSPLVGRLSDTYIPPIPHDLGQRMPYLVLGSVCTCVGLLGQALSSYYGFWIRYSFAFFLHMIGLNVIYAMMIALIPDQVPRHQTGVANGILALLLVTGSLFGFALFHSFLSESIQNMYGLYTCIVIATTILTATHAHHADAELSYQRMHRKRRHSMIAELATDQETRQLSTTPWKKAAQNAAKKAQQIVVTTPTLILRTMLVDPIRKLDSQTFYRSYTIDIEKNHDFFVVTISRLFYYCGMSVQTFFLYYLHDIIGVKQNPEAVVAALAILGQCSGAITCYPVGYISDAMLGGRRKPFVYFACSLLGSATLALLFTRTLEQMTICCLILGAANGMYLTMDTSLAVDTLPQEKEDDGDEDEGSAQLLGIWGVAAFLGSALGPMIGGPLLYYFGGQGSLPHEMSSGEREGEEYTITGYAVVLCLSTIYFFCSAYSLTFIRDHHE